MKNHDLLSITSLLSIVLVTFHLADDVVRGFEPAGLENLRGIAILAVWLYATLILHGRTSGYVILVLGSMLATGIPVVHMTGAGVARVAGSSGGLFFIWTLMALGVTGSVSLVLAVRGLWGSLRGQPVA